MYRLFVTQDATCHYQLYDQDESLEELKKRARKYDSRGYPGLYRMRMENRLAVRESCNQNPKRFTGWLIF